MSVLVILAVIYVVFIQKQIQSSWISLGLFHFQSFFLLKATFLLVWLPHNAVYVRSN